MTRKVSMHWILLVACVLPVWSVESLEEESSDISERKFPSHPKLWDGSFKDGDKRENPVEPPLLVGSFNIQTLGKKKFTNPNVIYTVEKIIRRYDLILLMELMTNDERFMKNLLRDVNLFAPDGVVYNMTLSDIHPDTSEHSAFLYRTNKLKVIKTESYEDASKFYRKPFVAIFESFTLRDMTRFGAIGHHVKPSQAVQEMDALGNLYDYVRSKYRTEDVLLMGDFNADCAYVGEQHWENISLWTRDDFTWAIGNHVDTTTNYRSCALDRFVYAGENMNDGVILSSAQIFNFQEEFDLTIQETRSISDHWPIELKIRGKMSTVAEKHLTTDICFKIRDSQPRRNITAKDVIKMAKGAHFSAKAIADGILMTNKTREKEDLLVALRELKLALPSIVTQELEEAIKYKMSHGSLEDESSFADVWNPGFKVDVFSTKEISEALVCRTTSVN